MQDLVDVIFLDIDGVLLPFGGVRDTNYHKSDSTADGCIFPDCTMDALTALLQQIQTISINTTATAIRGNPVLVLSSTWRARPEFIKDILSSFRAYYAATSTKKGLEDTTSTWEPHLQSFFDIVDPNYHATRHDEIYKWVNTYYATNATVRGKKQIIFEPQYNSTNNNNNNNGTNKKCIVRSWIALDDEDLVNLEGGRVSRDAMKHAVQTKSSVGLTLQDVRLGVRLLEKQIHEFHDGRGE